MPRAGIALGSNLGDRLGLLRSAVTTLRAACTDPASFLSAPVYETDPRDCPPDSPAFLNTVVEMECSGDHAALFSLLRSIEITLGRMRATERNLPRPLDADLLYFGDETVCSESLTIPHPRMLERKFVLRPLVDIRPDWTPPGSARSAVAWLAALDGDEQEPRRFADPL